jgi:hypothetical protein
MRTMRNWGVAGALLAGAAVAAGSGDADRVVPGELVVEPPTLWSLGFEWMLEGDANRNASVSVRYRRKGSPQWREGLPLLRLGGEQVKYLAVDYATPHMFAGSVFDLEPDTRGRGSSRHSPACWRRSTWAPRIRTGSTPTCRVCSRAT